MNIHIDNSKPKLIIGFIGDILSVSDWNYTSHMDGGNESWSITNPGKMTLYQGEHEVSKYKYPAEVYKFFVAHEFGHTLGISDAYKRPGSEAA
jgi:hypothetical protein